MLLAVIVAFACAGIAYGTYWLTVARYVESTDDAYVDGNVVPITPRVSGTVVAIEADDTQFVRAGQPLVKLDRVDARVALQKAKARLAQTVRKVRGVFARTNELRSEVAGRKVDLAGARADLARRQGLAKSGAVSAEEVQHARDAVRGAQSALGAVRQQLAGNRALVDDTTVASNPDVEHASAVVRTAYLAYRRAVIPAPVSGYVAKRSVQLGEHVSPGTPLMAIVPPDQVWVNANFKEVHLEDIRVGQTARVAADANGVTYHGTVVGFGAGTGAAFALLPAQNATGNWIKVVQRLPVRIALEPAEVEAHPLAIGLSMEVSIDVHGGAKQPDTRARTTDADYRTTVFADEARSVDALIAEIVEQNGGEGAVSEAAPGDAPTRARVADAGGR